MDISEEINEILWAQKWWHVRRLKYNIGLAGGGILALLCYMLVSIKLIMPYDPEFDITLFTIAFQAIGYCILMIVANLFYNLGFWADKRFNHSGSDRFRNRLFNIGFWFSFALPFSIPLLIIYQYFNEFY